MNLVFRLFYTLLLSRFRKEISVLGPCSTPFRCWPTDLDILRHMNNGKYFSLMDLGRVDLMIRAGLWTKLNAAGFYPVVAAETMRFHKSIGPFTKFQIETSVLGWDEKAFILRQRFVSGEKFLAEAVVRARFLKRSGGVVPPADILKLAGVTTPSPELEGWVKGWNEAQAVRP